MPTARSLYVSSDAFLGQVAALQPQEPVPQPQSPPTHLQPAPHLHADLGQSPPQPHLPVEHPHEPSTQRQPSPHVHGITVRPGSRPVGRAGWERLMIGRITRSDCRNMCSFRLL